MKYQIDHDLHIHSRISGCAGHDPRQTGEAILAYGLSQNMHLLCVTDHIWDEKVEPAKGQRDAWSWLDHGQSLEKGRELLPLPQSKSCRVLFGMEVDMDCLGNIGVSKEEMNKLDFLNFSLSHLHLECFTRDPDKVGSSAAEIKEFYKERIYRLLNMDLPFEKCGVAHFSWCAGSDEGLAKVMALFSDEEFRDIFGLIAEKGMGVELNFSTNFSSQEERETILRPYRIAKEMGCKFFLGSDAHTPEVFGRAAKKFNDIIEMLELTEEDKFPFVKERMAKEV